MFFLEKEAPCTLTVQFTQQVSKCTFLERVWLSESALLITKPTGTVSSQACAEVCREPVSVSSTSVCLIISLALMG